MKTRTIILAGLMVSLLASCNKSEVLPAAPQGEQVRMTVHVGAQQTKALSASKEDENKINSVQILVFDSEGVTEAFTKGSAGSLSVGVAAGQKTVWAVVNCADDLSAVRNAAELSSRAVDLKANSLSSLVMTGSKSVGISSSNKDVTVEVSHLVSKVVVSRISRDFSVPALASLPMTIRGVYLVNVVGNSQLGGAAAPSVWYNKLGHADPSLDALLFDSENATLANGASYSTVHTFYPFPNASLEASTSGTWSPRKTMLVIDTILGGENNYYPVFINSLERNKIYEFTSITITKRGSADPFTPVSTEDVAITVKVTDFTTGATYTETI